MQRRGVTDGAPGLDFGRNPGVLAELVRLGGLGLFTVDADRRFVAWSEGAARITGFAAGDVVGQPCEMLDGGHCRGFHGLGSMIEAAARGDALEVEEIAGEECRIFRADGTEVVVLGSARLTRDAEGRVSGAIGAIVDLSAALAARGEAAAPERGAPPGQGPLIGASRAMREVQRKIGVAAASDVTCVITGESGTGKELCARAIHEGSARAEGPFVAVNCAAIPDALLESELFGHARGAFTGADRDRDGLFVEADGGTLFLDEVAELPAPLQASLLRVLQERAVRRLGEASERPVDVRLLTATHRDLAREVAEGRMREDFYYRVHVFEIAIPPLRERPDDIPVLAEHFARELSAKHGRDFDGFSVDALQALIRHRWPGNGRELRNAVEHALVVAPRPVVDVFDLPAAVRGGTGPAEVAPPLSPDEEADKLRIQDALEEHGWNRTRTAEALGMSRVTLWKRIRRYRLDEGVFRAPSRRRKR